MHIERYKILHESVQNSHKFAWTMTSIFIPIAFGSMAFLVTHSDDLDIWQHAIGTVGIEGMLLFWVCMIKFLERCNKVRFELLKRIETHISSGAGGAQDIPFEYYTVLYDPEKREKIVPRWIKYKKLIQWFAIAFGVLVAANFVHRALTGSGG
jgi:hypothetical protein